MQNLLSGMQIWLSAVSGQLSAPLTRLLRYVLNHREPALKTRALWRHSVQSYQRSAAPVWLIADSFNANRCAFLEACPSVAYG